VDGRVVSSDVVRKPEDDNVMPKHVGAIIHNKLVYLLVFHAYINEMHGSRSKIPSKKSHPYIYMYIYIYIKFLVLLGPPYIYIYIYDISRLKVKEQGYNCASLISGRNMVSVLTDCTVYPDGPDTCTLGILPVLGVILNHVSHSSLAWAVLC
jgi:hypothetical protein